ncbi:MAG: hypothetical protein JXR32_02215, partial [Anaerolineaceae bacterium]|nr:hypothetical protein [Anaerolineaceae bacterium]
MAMEHLSIKNIFIVIISSLLVSCGQATPTMMMTRQPVTTIALPTPDATETMEPMDNEIFIPSSPVTPAEMAAVFSLPEGYLGVLLTRPAAAEVTAIARSQTGRIYLQQQGMSAAVSLLDPGSGEITAILSTIGLDTGRIFNGPGDAILMKVGSELWRIKPDGTHDPWSLSVFGVPLYCSVNGEIYGTTDDRQSVIRQSPGAAAVEVATGFGMLTDLVVSGDGTIIVVDSLTGDLVRVDPSGNQMLVDASGPEGELVDIALDAAGNLYRNNPSTGFAKVDLVSGSIETLASMYSPCTRQPGD